MSDSAKAKRRLPRFGTRTVLIAVALLAVILASLTAHVNRRVREFKHEEDAIKQIEKVGGTFDYRVVNDPLPRWFYGIDLRHVVGVDFTGTSVQDRELELLHKLSWLRRLNLTDTSPNLLAGDKLRNFTRLEVLKLDRTGHSDEELARLDELSQLKSLSLRGLPVSGKLLSKLTAAKQLRSLDITGTNIGNTDLSDLQSLTNLTGLSLSASQISKESVATFSTMPKLERVTIDVDAGTSKQVWQLTTDVQNVSADGVDETSGFVLWNNSKSWSETTAGLAELLSLEAKLDVQQSADLLAILGRARPGGDWPPKRAFNKDDRRQYQRKPAAPTAPLKNIDEFLERLRSHPNSYEVDKYAAEKVTAEDTPRLLETVSNKKWQTTTYGFLRRIATLLAEHGLQYPETEELFEQLLADPSATLPLTSPLSHFRSDVLPQMAVWSLNPDGWRSFDVPRAMTPDDARTAFRLLKPHATADNSSRGGVYSGILDVLGAIANRELAPEILPLFVANLASPETSEDACRAIVEVVEVSPEAAITAIPDIVRIVEHPNSKVRANALRSLGYVAAVSDETAEVAAKICLNHLDPPSGTEMDATYALAALVARDNPTTKQLVVRELIRVRSGNSPISRKRLESISIIAISMRDKQPLEWFWRW